MKKSAKKASDTFDWTHADAMTGEEITRPRWLTPMLSR